jgi:hypothetical protein
MLILLIPIVNTAAAAMAIWEWMEDIVIWRRKNDKA